MPYNEIWGNSSIRLTEAVANALAAIRKDGLEPHFFPMDPADVRQGMLLKELLPELVIEPVQHDVGWISQRLARCRIFIGERLHSIILASALGVPSVALEYRPKVADFQSSIAREAFTLRTDKATAGAILELAIELSDRYEHHSILTLQSVNKLRSTLHARAASARALVLKAT